jgi:protein-L-isoaspartate(D-aspartate) O-methyltransferase
MRGVAYSDGPLEIGFGQTISQPYINAYMIEALRLTGGEKVLEIGTGSGYQAALLSGLCRKIITLEIIPGLAQESREKLAAMGYNNVEVIGADASPGYEKEAPYDAIIVSCAPGKIPPAPPAQLAEGGRMIIPVGELYQELIFLEKKGGRVSKKSLIPVRFVPMTGRVQQDEAE